MDYINACFAHRRTHNGINRFICALPHIRRDQNGNYLSFIRSWEIELNILARLFAKARRDRRTDGNDGYP